MVQVDLRHSVIGGIIRDSGIDTVVHAGLVVEPARLPSRLVHETNVIGTLNLMAACGGPDSPVRHLVVRSGTAIYGSDADDPSFWSEEMTRRAPARDAVTSSLDEAETYVRDFGLRNPCTRVTVLRVASVLEEGWGPFSALFDLPAVPTVLGFDPRLQFLHPEDAVAALEHAVWSPVAGVFNLAGPGIVVLSQAIAMLGRVNLPVLPFVGGVQALGALDALTRVAGPWARRGVLAIPPPLVRLLQYGRVVDTAAIRERLGFQPRWTTLETVLEHRRRRLARRLTEVREEPAAVAR